MISQTWRHLKKTLRRSIASKYYSNVQYGSYKVTTARAVPSHIPRPPYVGNPNHPRYNLSKDPIKIFTEEEIPPMREAAKIVSRALQKSLAAVAEGITTEKLDEIVHQSIIQDDAYPSPIDFYGFPKSVCISLNEVLVHGVPDSRPLENGDYINIDVTGYKNGVHGDNSAMAVVGTVHDDILKLIQETKRALHDAIKICKPGVRFTEIGAVIHERAKKNNYGLCEIFGGHGIGKEMHMPPVVLHYKNNHIIKTMEKGMIFTIEPIILMEKPEKYYTLKDNWSVITPGVPSAQWEHTILITSEGSEILTLRPGETPDNLLQQQPHALSLQLYLLLYF